MADPNAFLRVIESNIRWHFVFFSILSSIQFMTGLVIYGRPVLGNASHDMLVSWFTAITGVAATRAVAWHVLCIIFQFAFAMHLTVAKLYLIVTKPQRDAIARPWAARVVALHFFPLLLLFLLASYYLVEGDRSPWLRDLPKETALYIDAALFATSSLLSALRLHGFFERRAAPKPTAAPKSKTK